MIRGYVYVDAMGGFLDRMTLQHNNMSMYNNMSSRERHQWVLLKPVAKVVINNICAHKSRGPQIGVPSMLGHPVHNHGG
jgi:hypothetical protein